MFKRFNTFNYLEETAALEVLRSGILSKFVGADGKDFYGGKYVQKLERRVEKYFNVKHAIAVNSWTSGLICSVGAIETEPGDEIITTPWTMCATSTAILHWNAIPVFADIDPKTFNIDPLDVASKVTSRTKAVIAVDIFGQSADYFKLRRLLPARVKLISDCAQAPGTFYHDKYSGTCADIGGFSLNYHKHIHCGEGGLIVTDDSSLAERCRLIRNHAEAVVTTRDGIPINNMLGYNFRLGEIEAAIAGVQLDKLESIISSRQHHAKLLNHLLSDCPLIITPFVEDHNTHAYYIYAMKLSPEINRYKFLEYCNSQNVKSISPGYTNLHNQKLYKHQIAYGNSNIPWSLNDKEYIKDIVLPNADKLHHLEAVTFVFNHYEYLDSDIETLASIFKQAADYSL